MTDEVTNSMILSTLMDIKSDIGGLKADGLARTDALNKHIALASATEERVRSLEQTRSRQKGVLATLAVFGTGIGAMIGHIFDGIISRGGGH